MVPGVEASAGVMQGVDGISDSEEGSGGWRGLRRRSVVVEDVSASHSS